MQAKDLSPRRKLFNGPHEMKYDAEGNYNTFFAGPDFASILAGNAQKHTRVETV